MHAGFDLRIHFGRVPRHSDRRLHETFGIRDLQDLAAFDALDQNLDVAVGQLQALHDVHDRAHLVDLVGLGLVHAGVVLRGQENLLICGQGFFERVDA